MVSVQKEYAESMLENTPQDFLQVLLSQQTQISNLKSLNERLSAENEDLLQLSENAKELAEENKALKNANEKLRNEKSRLEWQLKQSQDNEQSIRKQMEDMGDKYNAMLAKMPKSEDVENLNQTFKRAENSAGMLNALSIFNITALIIFVVCVVLTGWQVYWCRDDVRDTTRAVDTATQKIEGGLYNTDGYSVIKGSKSSKEVYDEMHPKK